MTLATVAEAAGVSRMTVSNAFNRPDLVSGELRERVLAAAAELGYAGPNPIARTLSRGRTGSVGLVLDYALTDAFRDPPTIEFLTGVAAGCESWTMGLSLVPRIAGRDAALVHTALVDGFVLYCVPEGDPRLEAVLARRLPYVGVDFEPTEGRRAVNIDDRAAARSVAEHVTALGHRRVAIVLPNDSAGSTGPAALAAAYRHVDIARLTGWRDGLQAVGIDWSQVPVASGPGKDRASGRQAAAALLDRPNRPTAIIALADELALGVIDAAAERGIAVPAELSVAGFDDIPAASPGLTTVRQPHARKGSEAVRLLLDPGAEASVLLPTELVIRASTAPAP
ncbi:LacI family DNA-binding transcriptional regulator [Solirubrobacter ginsenosidimutans]|uniref:LacI family DNA-binding transcriptional regulator n=1 Tax=Solirubrobacter ginsenosidimutans TaxID=490573 RepID=A0A9X3S5M1_9ACTN|nr:LacI family DNA-binding transcriptional regulator [Solirubrobacter ginsenosidimutans]MDA0166949.1 LacI family DNA-binding transcriptional regulator [Solirubrobacter ginsenosidimutans]